MRSWDALPQTQLIAAGVVTAQFAGLGLSDYRSAARFIGQLPYGRNADRSGFRLVIGERRGTCSTKHALLAALAIEQKLPIDLTLGIYEMNERNTPGVGVVLARYGLSCVPEAHCYLTYQGIRIDVTRSAITPIEPIAHFLHEETIVPIQIGDYKIRMHRDFIRKWSARELASQSSEQIWKIREECIAALSA